jgi:lysyl-tRNA synthetase class 2
MSGDESIRDKLKIRAAILERVRAFFAERDVVEVETPALSRAATTDPALISLHTDVAALDGRHYFQTSPEHAMKRLLVAGSGDIYQIARVYRDGELGRWHQPEFSLLEWYRVGFDEYALMNEVFSLLQLVLNDRFPALARQDLSYREAFQSAFAIDPLAFDRREQQQLAAALAAREIDVPEHCSANALLDLALSTAIVGGWPDDTAVFLYDYPASQAALAAIKPQDPPVAARFEVFLNGLELGNGFRELTDATDQRRRFESDLLARRAAGIERPPIDTDFLAALECGLPECAGVAIGLDRIVALAAGAGSLAEVVNFPHSQRGQ